EAFCRTPSGPGHSVVVLSRHRRIVWWIGSVAMALAMLFAISVLTTMMSMQGAAIATRRARDRAFFGDAGNVEGPTVMKFRADGTIYGTAIGAVLLVGAVSAATVLLVGGHVLGFFRVGPFVTLAIAVGSQLVRPRPALWVTQEGIVVRRMFSRRKF